MLTTLGGTFLMLKMAEHNDCDLKFWEDIEKEINEPIPEVIKISFSKCGYDSRISLHDVKLENVMQVEKYMMENHHGLLKQILKSQPKYNTLKFNRDQPFAFLPGHRNCIITIGKMIANTTVKSLAATHRAGYGKLSEPLPNDQSIELKSMLYKSIVSWAERKQFNEFITSSITIDQIQNLMRYPNQNDDEIKCQVLCPIETCGKKTVCIYKKYIRGGRKNQNETGKYRKATWYFQNLQSHLQFHQGQFGTNDEDLFDNLTVSPLNESKITSDYVVLQSGPFNDQDIVEDDNFEDEDIEANGNTFNSGAHVQTLGSIVASATPPSPLLSHSMEASSKTTPVRKSRGKLVHELVKKFSQNNDH